VLFKLWSINIYIIIRKLLESSMRACDSMQWDYLFYSAILTYSYGYQNSILFCPLPWCWKNKGAIVLGQQLTNPVSFLGNHCKPIPREEIRTISNIFAKLFFTGFQNWVTVLGSVVSNPLWISLINLENLSFPCRKSSINCLLTETAHKIAFPPPH